jgi:integrase
MISVPKIPLSSYVTDTYAVFRDIADDSVYQLRRSAVVYELWAQSRPDDVRHVDTITDDSLSRFLHDRRGAYSQAYLRKIRGDLLTLLRAAADDGLCEPPRKVRPIAKVKPKPRAWTREQVERIVAACYDYRGASKRGENLRIYFAAITMTAWDTGLRKEDLHSITQGMIGENGRITITQEKTDDEHYCRVSAETLRLLRSIPRDRPLQWLGCDDQFYYHWRRIVKLSGVPYLGAMHAMRKSGTTEVARINPGAETRFLGHTTPAADVHYIDRALTADHAVMPTALNVVRDPQKMLF